MAKKLNRLLEWLGCMGVERLTVSTPFLLERIKACWPEFAVKVGIYAQVDTPRRAKFWQDLGADSLTLESFSINRDFRRLKAIRAAVDCDLQLIANHPCLPNCALQVYHQNCFAHSSNGSGRMFIDYCFLKCSRQRMQDPSFLIKAGWIRPEDTSYYEKLGYGNFKLLERGIPSNDLLGRVEAYSRRISPANLADLILPYGFRQAPQKQPFWFMRHFFRPTQINPLRLKFLFHFIRKQGMLFPVAKRMFTIDSSSIPANFIEGFESRNCAERDCEKCGYCHDIAAKAVSVDPDISKIQLPRLKRIETMLVDLLTVRYLHCEAIPIFSD